MVQLPRVRMPVRLQRVRPPATQAPILPGRPMRTRPRRATRRRILMPVTEIPGRRRQPDRPVASIPSLRPILMGQHHRQPPLIRRPGLLIARHLALRLPPVSLRHVRATVARCRAASRIAIQLRKADMEYLLGHQPRVPRMAARFRITIPVRRRITVRARRPATAQAQAPFLIMAVAALQTTIRVLHPTSTPRQRVAAP